ILRRHVVPADVDTVAPDGERHVDAVVDDKRHAAERRFDGASPLHHDARVAKLVAELYQGHATGRQHPAETDDVMAAGHLRINNGVAAEIDTHQLTFALAISVSRSSAYIASRISMAKLPGPRARAAANSPATPMMISAAAVAFQASGSTASVAPTSAEAAQPIAVTRAISGWPLAMVARRLASRTRSRSPVRPITVCRALAKRASAASSILPADSAPNSARFSRSARGFF